MIPKLRPGQEITAAHLNRIIDGVNAAQITSSDFPLERTSAGTKLSMPQKPEHIFARIIETPERKRDGGGDIKDGEYEWKEVYLPNFHPETGAYPPDEFEDFPEGMGHGSFYDQHSNELHDPAYELSNNRQVEIGTLVRMWIYPAVVDHDTRGLLRRYVFKHVKPAPLLLARALMDWQENGTYPEGHPRILVQQLITDPDVVPDDPEGNNPHPKKLVYDIENPDDSFFFVELPRERDGGTAADDGEGKSHGADPALYEDDEFYYTIDDQDRKICVSPYLHMGKIGEIRMMSGTPTYAIDNIPKGWAHCDGKEKTGNAGNITLADFWLGGGIQALGGSTVKYSCLAMSHSSDIPPGDKEEFPTFDALGEFEAGGPSPIKLPNVGQARTTPPTVGGCADPAHTHSFEADSGEYWGCAALFYQRYK